MKRKSKYCYGLFLLCSVDVFAQVKEQIREGNRYYQQARYAQAERIYRGGLKMAPEDVNARYNMANALYKQKRYEEAVKHYEKCLPLVKDLSFQARLYFNLGDAYIKQQAYEKAVQVFKKSLMINPYDEETRYNFALAKDLWRMRQLLKRSRSSDDRKSSNKAEDLSKPSEQNRKGDIVKKKDFTLRFGRKPFSPIKKKSLGGVGLQSEKRAAQDSVKGVYRKVILRALRYEERNTQRKILRKKTAGKDALKKDW